MHEDRPLLDWIDWYLIAAIIGLATFLTYEVWQPASFAWRNRIRPGVQVCQRFIDESEPRRWCNYLLYLPLEYRKDRKWPLVVFLHGSGERGRDLEVVRQIGLPKQIALGGVSPVGAAILDSFILASPQCPSNSGWEPDRIVALIEHLGKEFSIDQDRIYLTGFSMGGCGTWQTACEYPKRFAAIVPLAGGGNDEQAERLKDLPIWAFHGAKDETVPLEASQKMVDAVRKYGGSVEFTVYPDAEHGICDETYENPKFYEWLLTQRRHRNK